MDVGGEFQFTIFNTLLFIFLRHTNGPGHLGVSLGTIRLIVGVEGVSLIIEVSGLENFRSEMDRVTWEVHVFWQVIYNFVILETVNLARLEGNQWI